MFILERIQGFFVDIDIKEIFIFNNFKWEDLKYVGIVFEEEKEEEEMRKVKYVLNGNIEIV